MLGGGPELTAVNKEGALTAAKPLLFTAVKPDMAGAGCSVREDEALGEGPAGCSEGALGPVEARIGAGGEVAGGGGGFCGK